MVTLQPEARLLTRCWVIWIPYLVAWVRFLLLTANVIIVVLRLETSGTICRKWEFGLLLLLQPMEPMTVCLFRRLRFVWTILGLAELSTTGKAAVAVSCVANVRTLVILLCFMQLT